MLIAIYTSERADPPLSQTNANSMDIWGGKKSIIATFNAMSKIKDKDILIDSHVSLRQCKLAIDALHAHCLKLEEKAAETELLPGKEQFIWLQVAVKKMQPEKKIKPFKMCVFHPFSHRFRSFS